MDIVLPCCTPLHNVGSLFREEPWGRVLHFGQRRRTERHHSWYDRSKVAIKHAFVSWRKACASHLCWHLLVTLLLRIGKYHYDRAWNRYSDWYHLQDHSSGRFLRSADAYGSIVRIKHNRTCRVHPLWALRASYVNLGLIATLFLPYFDSRSAFDLLIQACCYRLDTHRCATFSAPFWS